MRGVAVEVRLGHVVPQGGARVGVPHRVLHVPMAIPATSPVVQKVWRGPCGLIGWLREVGTGG